MKRVYLAGGISDRARKAYQAEVADKIEAMGYSVYAASKNDSINDKSNNPTPLDIYKGDIEEIMACDIAVIIISGAGEDGTISEVGMISGWNEMVREYNSLFEESCDRLQIPYEDRREYKRPIKIVAYTTNERLMEPQFWKGDKEGIKGLASAGFNHLVAGMIDKWGTFVGTEEDMLDIMQKLK